MDEDNSSAPNLAAALQFQNLPAKLKRDAVALVRADAVFDFHLEDDFSGVDALVTDRAELEVILEFDARTLKWKSECERCRKRWCAHAAAVLSYYLARMVPVSTDEAPPLPSKMASVQDIKGAAQLDTTAVARLGRALRPDERSFVQAVRRMYQSCDDDGSIYESVLWSLGWSGHLPSYGTVALSVGRPDTELQFWFGLAELAKQRNYSIPAFLKELKPSAEFNEMLAKAQRDREIKSWLHTLKDLPAMAPVDPPPVAEELRFRLLELELVPEVRWGELPWRTLKASRLQEFNQAGATRLNHQAGALWASFFPLASFYGLGIGPTGAQLTQWLGLHLRLPALIDFFVDAAGRPILRHEVPLRWHITEPTQPDGDYEISLVDGAGNPPNSILARFPGTPPLYLTASGLFPGPALIPSSILPGKPTRIPAAALESAIGLRLLDLTRLPPPARMAARIRTVHLGIALSAELKRSPSVSTEYCLLRVSAAAPDGRFRHVLEELGWREPVKQTLPEGELIRLDRSDLMGLPELVSEVGFKIDPYNGYFSVRVTKAFPAQFQAFLARLPELAEVNLVGELASLRDGPIAGTLRLEAEEAGTDWFDLKVVVNVEDTTLSPEEIKLLVAARGQWVRLEQHGWRRLDYQLTDQEESDLARIGLTPRELSAEPQRLHALQLADPSARRFLPDETAAAIDRKAAELRTRVTPAQPSAVRAELRPYQLEGFHFLAYLTANRFGGVLADDMGLGKTLQTLTWLAWLRAEGALPERRSLPAIVICPKSVQDNWRAEAERFYPDLRVRVWKGVAATDLNTALASGDLHVLNYAQLRAAEGFLLSSDFLAAILDEGQNIKNPSSQTAQVACRLRADYRLILTGTPIENRLLDLWSLLAFAMPGVLGSRAGFSRLYDGKDDPFARARLAARVRPFLLRRTKAQVARDLPDRVEEDLYCELEGEQRSLYRAELKVAQQHLLKLKTQKALNKDRFHLLTSLLRLRQICCHPRLLKPDAKQDGAKLEALLETLEPMMEEGEKVLVFSQFVELLALLKPALEARGWTYWYLAGETENRGELVQRFQKHEGGGVFLISLKAGGAGLNLTAASYVVLFDPWWNPAVENQAIDRTHRIGQTRKIMAYRLLIKDSIEEKIRALQKSKSLLADEVLGEERFSAALTLDDLRFLLAD